MTADTSARIGFRRHLRAITVPEEGVVYLVSARGTVALSGDRAVSVAPLLDGTLTMAEIRQRTAGRLAPGELAGTLATLAQADLISLRRPGPEADTAAGAYWDLIGADADAATDRLAAATVRVLSLGATGVAEARSALRACGLAAQDGPDLGQGLTMVLCDDYLDPRLERINAAMLAAGRAWLPAKPTGVDVWVGPVFRGGEGPCWCCLATRLRARRTGETLARGCGATVTAPETSLPTTRVIGLQLAVLEAVKWLSGATGTAGSSTLRTFDTLTWQSGQHQVDRRPQCPACGDAGLMTAQVAAPVRLAGRPKASVAGNGHRARSPEQVWEAYQHLADPITGITDPIRRDPRCPDFLHSCLSGANRAVVGRGLAAARAGLRQQSGGKGSTEIEARVGALCEAVERWSGSRFGDEPVIRASLRELGDRAVHPDACQLFDPRQFRDRDRWNAANGAFQHVPEPFDETEAIDWTPVWSLTRQCSRLMPTDLLYFTPDSHPALRATSNGNAAGASREDAIMQGLLELVERDAVALWWYNRTRQPAVDLASFADPWIDALPARYAEVHRELWLLDLTADLGVPVMAAISRRTDKPAEDLMLGFGAHPDPTVAARRALTELGQLLPAVVRVDGAGNGYGAQDPHIMRWWRSATVANQPYLRPGAMASRRRADYRYDDCPDLREDVERLVARAAAEDLEVFVLDQTRPDVGLPVVKVIVPGLRHFWARFAPGRLFDVPVRAGRLAAPTSYPDLNPIPLFL
ncbi:TOMM precursor leader peptide-binding protein [Luedemannella helvata]|uniref:TOMM leader peptide-binding protein n=1 Tax=Luedemannella helvata TaxID=349315 RepID=A0ABP4VYR5_9ACTN